MSNKKIRIMVVVLILILTVTAIQANENSVVWTSRFKLATTLEEKSNVIAKVVEQHDRDMIPLLTEALKEQVDNLENHGNASTRYQTTEYTKMIVKELGQLEASEAVFFIWQIVTNVEEPFLKGEAIIALGKIGAIQYVDELNTLLQNINFNYFNLQDQRKNEIIAFSLIIAMDRLKSPDSYSPLFFASAGWYSPLSGVRKHASDVLDRIVEDPYEKLSQIMSESNTYDIKLLALQVAEISKASDKNKAALSILALKESLRYLTKNPTECAQLKSLRIKALNMLEALPVKPIEAEQQMERMLYLYRTERLFDINEMVELFKTYGTYPSDRSVNAMTEFLSYLTNRRADGGIVDYRIAKSVLMAIGNTGNPLGSNELMRVEMSDVWENALKREARNAINK